MLIRIEATDLPGRAFAPVNGDAYDDVHVAVQGRNRPAELLDPVPGDAPSATWTLDCAVSGADVTGPYVQGRPGDRFIYLSWGAVDPSGWNMFRRAKLLLTAIPPEVLRAAEPGTLVGRLTLTDAKGGPRCARVVPPAITWTLPD
ncbi:MAG TPA: DUF5990 family protein [Streptosporangiaceae bacterium]|jgi:hypothetical protein